MSNTDQQPTQLFSASGANIEALVDGFEQAWRSGASPPSLAEFLPGEDSQRREALLALVAVDLEYRWKLANSLDSVGPALDSTVAPTPTGGAPPRPRLEYYVRKFPDLGRPDAPPLDLIAAEYRARHRWGDRPEHVEFATRFATLAEALGIALTQVDQELAADELTAPHERIAFPADLKLPPSGPGTCREAGPAPRYRAVRFHAKGGIGEVHLAQDAELRREVALKRIQEPLADNIECRRRFLLEAEITARLQHPGIVPVYGLVEDEAGQPCYAMRFIEGQSLKESIERFHAVAPALGDGKLSERGRGELTPRSVGHTGREKFASLEFRKLLGRFVDACNAVAYAHSQGVVHRDLKPANIMLGEYGETLVVDWGLAKVFRRADTPDDNSERDQPNGDAARGVLLKQPTMSPNSDSTDRTRRDDLIGTPQFMSPEQAERRHDLVGPTSDVYSLGATLYALITGKHPFSGNTREELLDRVKSGSFARPRDFESKAPAALEAVCLKAMMLRPENRYISPRALADDIEHWLADEPVAAHCEPLAERVGRWLRKHRAWTRAGAAALLLVSMTAVSAAVLIDRARRDEERQRRRADESATAARVAQEAEAKQLTAAQRALAAETDAKRAARQAIEKYVAAVNREGVLQEARLQPLRKELLADALGYYEQFVREHWNQTAERAELAEALLQVARINLHSGSGPQAETAYRQAHEIYQQLSQADPQAAKYREGVLDGLQGLAGVHLQAGKLPEALAEYESALGLASELADQDPKNAALRRQLGFVHHNLGMVRQRLGRREEALESFQQAIAIESRLAESAPTSADEHRQLGRSYNELGTLLRELGRPRDAFVSFQRALQIQQRLVDEHPGDGDVESDLARSFSNLAMLHERAGETQAAWGACQRARDLRKALAARHPHELQFQVDLARSLLMAGNLSHDLKQEESSERDFIDALALRRRLCDEHPDNLAYVSELAAVYNDWGERLRDLGRHDEALTAFEQAVELQRPLFEKSPEAIRFWVLLSMHYFGLAHVYRAMGQPAQAAAVTETRKQLWPDDPLQLYNAACEFAMCVPLLGNDSSQLSGDDKAAWQKYADRAMAALREAAAAGFNELEQLKKDPDLDTLRSREDFQQFLRDLETGKLVE